MDKTFYITTAINYTNGSPHVGHAYEAIIADIIARYNKINNKDTYFLTGTDEHGQKIEETAKKNNVLPIEICNKYYDEFINLNKRLNISNNNFIRTSDDKHKYTVQMIIQKCIDNGDIYLGNYSGWYNLREETFVTENEAKLCDYKDIISGNDLIKMEEPSYFFKLSKYRSKIIEHIKNNPNFIKPQYQQQLILNRLQDDLHDLSISRTTFDWGIKMPNDSNHVVYVWFDALINYLSGIDWSINEEKKHYWPPNVQIVGKDIMWFHCVIWPAILMSNNLPLPKTIFGHGFIHDENGYKMSKSLLNVIDPNSILDKYSSDSLRISLINQNPLHNDLSFSIDKLVFTHNADLADTIGNLINRCSVILGKISNNIIPDVEPEIIIDLNILNEIDDLFNSFDLHLAYDKIISSFKLINLYLTQKAPWKIKDIDDIDYKKRQIILRSALEAIYIMSHLLYPFAPETTEKIFETLSTLPTTINNLKNNKNLLVNTFIKKFTFTKIEMPKKNTINTKKLVKQHIFTKLDIRVGHIKKVWNHPTSIKLYCEEIDIGNKILKIASGLQQHIPIEEFLDKKVLVLCNIKPIKLLGFESEGMVLCASNDNVIKLLECENAQIGEKIFLNGIDTVENPIIINKKVIENVFPHLKTNSEGYPCFDNIPFMTNSGLCNKTISDANIS